MIVNEICESTGEREHIIVEWLNKSTLELTCNVHHISWEENPTGERLIWFIDNVDSYGIHS